MRDYGLTPDPRLQPADRAVSYLLTRLQFDADLRWLLAGTEAYRLLIDAEAHRLGQTPDQVLARRKEDLRAPDDRDPPRIPRLREQRDALLQALQDLFEEGQRYLDNSPPATAALNLIRQVERSRL